jgi:predicted metal-binding protein
MDFRGKALELGADDAREISVEDIPIEDEVVEMCEAPLCKGFGKSINCPPHVMKPDRARLWIRSFDKAVIFKIDVPPHLLLSKDRFKEFRKIYVIASALEKSAVSQGFSASGLAAGSCKPVFCRNDPCGALQGDRSCRYAELARPSMEAVGINVFKLVRNIGWEIHRILETSKARDIPAAMLAGLLLYRPQPLS